eukprot:1506888-Pyramimonas_sp.AAC.1
MALMCDPNSESACLVVARLCRRVPQAQKELGGFLDLNSYDYSMSKAQILDRIQLWDANSTSYTLMSWAGGEKEYLTCDLRSRARRFAGVCVPYNKMNDLAGPDRNPSLPFVTANLKAQECTTLCYCDPEVVGTCNLQGADDDDPTDNEICACEACEMSEPEMDALYDALLVPPVKRKRYMRNLLQERDTAVSARNPFAR